MIFERVNFNEEVIKQMSRDEFEQRHINHFWLDRDEATRKKMLDEVYDLINPSAGGSESEEE
ncbi:MAG: hypothetical protein J6C59_09420 [Muribaculaceae bacterium]|nr:hypothetical protein [Muribaculaceae bacterium]